MSTCETNPRDEEVCDEDRIWIFGYGSLVWRPAFPYIERRAGFILNWTRRFWQASTDHRGLPQAPGRVVTLIPEAGAICWGTAYRVAATERAGVLANLDYRERGGFERDEVLVHFGAAQTDTPDRGSHSADDSLERVPALMYVATPKNPNYLGPASEQAIAAQVRGASGPSGSNREYVERLAIALRDMGASDDHVFAIAARLDRD